MELPGALYEWLVETQLFGLPTPSEDAPSLLPEGLAVSFLEGHGLAGLIQRLVQTSVFLN